MYCSWYLCYFHRVSCGIITGNAKIDSKSILATHSAFRMLFSSKTSYNVVPTVKPPYILLSQLIRPTFDFSYCVAYRTVYFRVSTDMTLFTLVTMMMSHVTCFVRRHRVLKESAGIEEVGDVNWELALCLLATWLLVYLSLYKGVKSSGKVSFPTHSYGFTIPPKI